MASRIGGNRTGMSSSYENRPVHFTSAALEKAGSTISRDPPGCATSRSALGDISAIVSNVSSSAASVAAALAGGLTTARGDGAKPGLFSATNSTNSLHRTTREAVAEEARGVEMDDVDKADANDPQCVSEYVGDIFQNFRQEESRYAPHPDYMEKQQEISEKMRGILVDWLVEVHLKYKLKHETLYLAVSLIDRFLDKRQVSRKRLQLVGVTGMLIAAKYEEIYPPEIREFVYITDKAYTREEILSMEITMLNALEFHLTLPSPVAFLERFAKLNKCDQVHLDLARYVMELSLLDLKMLRYCPSHLAASAIFLSNKLLRRHPSWPAHLIKHTRYTDGLIKSCAKEICALVEGADRSSLAAIRKKYASEKFHGVSKMVTTAA